jgi:hypothetical protein
MMGFNEKFILRLFHDNRATRIDHEEEVSFWKFYPCCLFLYYLLEWSLPIGWFSHGHQ